MNIIVKTAYDNGCYPAMQTWDKFPISEGYAVWPETLDTADFYTHNGFVILTIEDMGGVDTVTSYKPNVEAWEVWKASLPEPELELEPELTVEERVTVLEEQLAETDEAAIQLYEASLAQEAVNAEQDEAIIEIYEMMEGMSNG